MNIGKLFFKGILFVLPIALTFTILNWLFGLLTPWVFVPVAAVIPESFRFSGLEYLLSIILVVLIGALVHWQLSNVFMKWLERILGSVPVINVVYNNLREIVDFVSGNREQSVKRVVLASLNDHVNVVGLVTKAAGRTSLSDHPDLTAVFIPMSYQMGGFLTYLPEQRLQTLNLSASQAMQLCLTADISQKSKEKET